MSDSFERPGIDAQNHDAANKSSRKNSAAPDTQGKTAPVSDPADDILFLIRTNRFGEIARLSCDRLSRAGVPILVVADERKGEVETAPYDKISITERKLADLGFHNLPDDWGWFCGDLCYALAIAERPDFKRFALIEDDVFIPETSTQRLIEALSDSREDAVAMQLGPYAENPKFSRGLNEFYLDSSWGCIFPLTRVTADVARQMGEFRRRQLDQAPKARLNDEAILAGALQLGSFTYARLEEVAPDLFSPQTFDTNPPHLFDAIAQRRDEHRIFHPAISYETVIRKLKADEKGFTRWRLRNVLKQAPAEMRKEIDAFLEQKETPPTPDRSDVSGDNSLSRSVGLASQIKILDVGANPLIEGEVSYRRLLESGNAHVFGFEPQEDALEALNAQKSDNESYFPHVLGDGGAETLRVTRSPGFTSIFPADPEAAQLLGFSNGMDVVKTISLQSHKLDELDDIPAVDFLKIDVQGSELSILRHGAQKLAQAVLIQTEVRLFSIYADEPSYGALEAELAAQGFKFLNFLNLKHVPLSRPPYRNRLRRHQFSQVVDGDAFFVRDLRKIDSWDTDMLRTLAVLADSVVGNPDLTVFALEKLVDRGAVKPQLIEDYIGSLPPEWTR